MHVMAYTRPKNSGERVFSINFSDVRVWPIDVNELLAKHGENVNFASPLKIRDYLIFTARRNARIASAVLATAIPSVCLSVCPSVTRRAGIVSKRRHV